MRNCRKFNQRNFLIVLHCLNAWIIPGPHVCFNQITIYYYDIRINSRIYIYIHRKMSPILTPIWSSCVIDWWKWETSNGMTMRSKIDVYVASRERIGHPAECIYRKPFEGNRNGKERWRRHEGLSSHWSSMIYWVISLRYLFFIDENLSFVPYARMCLWKCDYRSIEYCSRDDKKHHQICWMSSCEQNISSDKLRWRISIFFDDWVQN